MRLVGLARDDAWTNLTNYAIRIVKIMSGSLRQLSRAVVLLPLVWVALLLPTLHVHTFLEHEHGTSDMHGHAVAHADFLAAAIGHGHGETAEEHPVPDHSQSGLSYQINFLSLVPGTSLTLLNTSQPACVLCTLEEPVLFRPSIQRCLVKPDLPPPIAAPDLSSGTPRSPPRSV